MDRVGTLADSCRRILGEKGRLSTAIPGFVSRAPQSDLAAAIAQAITNKSMLVAEAGTGTGKTFAYLLPCLLSGKKVLVSTATKTLQDQLFQKDLPTLVKAMGLSARVQNLKGRSNYICRHRVALHAEEGHFQTPQSAHEILHIRDKLSQLQHGERSELPEINEESPVWHYATSTTDNCLGNECPDYEDCFLVKARKKAMEADVVVINHHLFFADSRLKQQGFGELLPNFEVVVFDEAHQLAEIAANFNGDRLGTRQFQDLLDDTLAEWPVLDLPNQPLKVLRHQADKLIDELFRVLNGKDDRLGFDAIRKDADFMRLWEEWLALIAQWAACFTEDNCREHVALKRCQERLNEQQALLKDFNQVNADKIRWLERFKQTLVFHATPFDIAQFFRQQLRPQEAAYVFTSATLTMANSFECFTKPLGLDNAQTLLLPSPFNFTEQALLYLPRGMPDPKQANYHEILVEKVLPLIEACGGRCFFLFTSHKALKHVAQMLSNKLNYPLLVQGDEAKPILLARFRQLGNAVLLGTATFWEGVDVKGEALSCVIIDKLPFANPFDPLTHGRMTYLKNKGLSGFDELSLPNAVIALKQGVGRLIRDSTDRGLLMIADPRLTGKEYGRTIFSSLPDIPKTRDDKKVMAFISTLFLETGAE